MYIAINMVLVKYSVRIVYYGSVNLDLFLGDKMTFFGLIQCSYVNVWKIPFAVKSTLQTVLYTYNFPIKSESQL